MSEFMIYEQMQEQFAFFKNMCALPAGYRYFSFAPPDCSAMTGDYYDERFASRTETFMI